jgi:hypothetical protein
MALKELGQCPSGYFLWMEYGIGPYAVLNKTLDNHYPQHTGENPPFFIGFVMPFESTNSGVSYHCPDCNMVHQLCHLQTSQGDTAILASEYSR